MFNNCFIMVIRADDPSQILRLEVDEATQQAVCKTLSASVADLVKDKTIIIYSATARIQKYGPHMGPPKDCNDQ